MDVEEKISESESNKIIESTVQNEDLNSKTNELTVKVICLGDSAVGKSKLLDRFLVNSFKPQQFSTYALTLYRYAHHESDEPVIVEFWDTAGQERFFDLHPSYYHQADACIMVFDATRKVTYKNLPRWLEELRQYRPEIPVYCAANKIDANLEVTARAFAFTEKNNIPLYFVSASDGTNVVRLFHEAIAGAIKYKKNPSDWADNFYSEMERLNLATSSDQSSKVKESGE